MTTAEVTRPSPAARLVALGGTTAVLTTVAMIGALDLKGALVSTAGLRRTISQYGLGADSWIFEVAVSLLAAGSFALLAVLVRQGITRWRSTGAVALTLWSVGLALVVVFPKQDWSLPASAGGGIHRMASLLAFVSLPVAVLSLARPWLRHPRWAGHARWTFGLGLLSVAAFTPLLYAVLVHASGGAAWWRVFPIGYVERVLVISEVIAVLAAGLWAIAAANRPKLGEWQRGETSRRTSATSTT
ncbi:DUF998 domain-containing protein [Umezawaea tangerina]|uniref:Uncharacterized protein DUF998 n=1 Tax=Umezawaea tangerina TaxID=84725 RepID=A0A2T0SME3_9PSEU|nr:DUF998 domain-containing protein [Umezawaea tangerina]PRY34589.1 uncharacterized protein DUF998 [Umezawaea tangerina]